MPDEDPPEGSRDEVEELEIRFDSDPAVYREGDNVTGMLHVKVSTDIQYTVISIELCGFAVVRWNLAEGETADQLSDPDNLKGDCNKEEYFNKKITLQDRGGNDTALLGEGEHDLPFELKLLPELPSSFEGQYGQVRYLARGCLERHDKPSVVTKRAFTLLSGLDLNFIPEAACKIEICKYKPIGNCCTSGSVVIDWTVARSGYVPGEDININGAVQNESKATVAYSMVTLYMVIEYKSKKGRRKERRKIASAEKEQTLPGDVTVWHEKIHIPPLPPTGIGRSIIIDINYQLEFKALIEGSLSPIVFTKDLYVGTVPMSRKEMKSCIAGMFNRPYAESTDKLDVKGSGSQASLTHIIVAASTVEPKVSPTAPSLATLDRAASLEGTQQGLLDCDPKVAVDSNPGGGDGDEPHVSSRPPPFAPGYSVVQMDPNPSSPTAPTTNTLLRPWGEGQPLLTDPTFESSAIFGPVSLRDSADDTESLRGEFVYHPVYAYFGTLPPGARPLYTP